MARAQKTADDIILEDLIHEFGPSYRREVESKIKRRLRYYQAGPYDQARVDRLRELQQLLLRELGNPRTSRYYVGAKGKYAALEDYDLDRLINDAAAAFPDVDRTQIADTVPFAAYLYYLR